MKIKQNQGFPTLCKGFGTHDFTSDKLGKTHPKITKKCNINLKIAKCSDIRKIQARTAKKNLHKNIYNAALQEAHKFYKEIMN